MTLAEQIQFVEDLISEHERRAKLCEMVPESDQFGAMTREIAGSYRRKANGLREVDETLYRYQSLWS